MTSHPLGNVFEAMMKKGKDRIPDEGFLMTKMPMYFIVTVDKILLCSLILSIEVESTFHFVTMQI
jgi:hypothetical protein